MPPPIVKDVFSGETRRGILELLRRAAEGLPPGHETATLAIQGESPFPVVKGSQPNTVSGTELTPLISRLFASDPRMRSTFVHTHPYGYMPVLSGPDLDFWGALEARHFPRHYGGDIGMTVAQMSPHGEPPTWSSLYGIRPDYLDFTKLMHGNDLPLSAHFDLDVASQKLKNVPRYANESEPYFKALFMLGGRRLNRSIDPRNPSRGPLARYRENLGPLPEPFSKFIEEVAGSYPLPYAHGGSVRAPDCLTN